MKKITQSRKGRMIAGGILTLILLLTIAAPVFAEGETSDPPADPGVGDDQDNSKEKTTKWVFPHGSDVFLSTLSFDADGEIPQDLIDAYRSPGQSDVEFLGLNDLYDYGDDSYYTDTVCGEGGGLSGCFYDVDKPNGNNGNGGGPLKPDDTSCGGVWITPGQITANAWQIAPGNSVVVGQDPEENGATIQWHVVINPTTVAYTQWQIIGHRLVACVENGPDGAPVIGEDVDDKCPHGWHSVIQHIWGCAAKEKTYPEGIGDLSAKANLQPNSRAWIQGELAAAYPGAHLINPDWSFSTMPSCVWVGDVCIWDFTLTIPVADPGWYDLKVEGSTAGTTVTPPRSFGVTAGEFGTYLIDSSQIP